MSATQNGTASGGTPPIRQSLLYLTGAVGAVALLVFGLITIGNLLGAKLLAQGSQITEVSSAFLVLIGAVCLVIVFIVAGVVFKWMGISQDNQAFGLPDGSIRAVIATFLIMLFAILPLYFYANQAPQQPQSLVGLTVPGVAAMSKIYTVLSDTIVKSPDPKAPDTHTIQYIPNSVTPAAQDIAKQFITALVTLVTAVVSFYFGSAAATSAVHVGANAASTQTNPAPSKPSPVLNLDSHVVSGGNPVQATLQLSAPVTAATTITLASSSPAAIVGPNVVAAVGASSVTFTINTIHVDVPTTVTISAAVAGAAPPITTTLTVQ